MDYKTLDYKLCNALKEKGFGRKKTYYLMDVITGRACVGVCRYDLSILSDLIDKVKGMTKAEINKEFAITDPTY